MQTTKRPQDGFTLIEMMVVILLIGIIASTAVLTLGSSTSKAYGAAMRSDLRLIAAAQESYIETRFAETGDARYADDVSVLQLNLSNGVQVEMRGNDKGWSARTTHSRVAGARCAMFRGTIRILGPAVDEGKITCDNGP